MAKFLFYCLIIIAIIGFIIFLWNFIDAMWQLFKTIFEDEDKYNNKII